MGDETPNQWMLAAQDRKRDRLVEYLQDDGVAHAEAARLNSEQIERVAASAGVNMPGSSVWSSVLDALDGNEYGEQGTMFTGGRTRWSRDELAPVVADFDRMFADAGLTDAVRWVGSWRRKSARLHNLNLLFVTDLRLIDLDLPGGLAVRSTNSTASRHLDLADGSLLEITLARCGPAEEGPALVYWTGPARLNVEMRSRAKNRGLMLSKHGVFNDTGQRIDVNTEESVFFLCGLGEMSPEYRQSRRTRKPMKETTDG